MIVQTMMLCCEACGRKLFAIDDAPPGARFSLRCPERDCRAAIDSIVPCEPELAEPGTPYGPIDYYCRRCQAHLFSSDARRGRVPVACFSRRCRVQQTVQLGSTNMTAGYPPTTAAASINLSSVLALQKRGPAGG